MSDNYQAVYDAMRSCLGGVNQSIQTAADRAFDISFAVRNVEQALIATTYDMVRPSVLYRPVLIRDGDQWSALYGENLQSGVAGFGSSPAEAMADFDEQWTHTI